MFEEIIKAVAHEMDEVAYVDYADEIHAVVFFYSRSGKSKYPCEFSLCDDGKTVHLQYRANGSYYAADTPRLFREKVEDRLRLL